MNETKPDLIERTADTITAWSTLGPSSHIVPLLTELRGEILRLREQLAPLARLREFAAFGIDYFEERKPLREIFEKHGMKLMFHHAKMVQEKFADIFEQEPTAESTDHIINPLDHIINPLTDRCVMCGRNEFNRRIVPFCERSQKLTSNEPIEAAGIQRHSDGDVAPADTQDSLSELPAESREGRAADSVIPDRKHNPYGLHRKYTISKIDGTPIDPSAEYFVLRLDQGCGDKEHLHCCRAAAISYWEASAQSSSSLVNRIGSELRAVIGQTSIIRGHAGQSPVTGSPGYVIAQPHLLPDADDEQKYAISEEDAEKYGVANIPRPSEAKPRWPHDDTENAIHVGGNDTWDFWIHKNRKKRDITKSSITFAQWRPIGVALWHPISDALYGPEYVACDAACKAWLAAHPEPQLENDNGNTEEPEYPKWEIAADSIDDGLPRLRLIVNGTEQMAFTTSTRVAESLLTRLNDGIRDARRVAELEKERDDLRQQVSASRAKDIATVIRNKMGDDPALAMIRNKMGADIAEAESVQNAAIENAKDDVAELKQQRDKLKQQLADIRKALNPVIDWYQDEETETQLLASIVGDVADDLQEDRRLSVYLKQQLAECQTQAGHFEADAKEAREKLAAANDKIDTLETKIPSLQSTLGDRNTYLEGEVARLKAEKPSDLESALSVVNLAIRDRRDYLMLNGFDVAFSEGALDCGEWESITVAAARILAEKPKPEKTILESGAEKPTAAEKEPSSVRELLVPQADAWNETYELCCQLGMSRSAVPPLYAVKAFIESKAAKPSDMDCVQRFCDAAKTKGFGVCLTTGKDRQLQYSINTGSDSDHKIETIANVAFGYTPPTKPTAAEIVENWLSTYCGGLPDDVRQAIRELAGGK